MPADEPTPTPQQLVRTITEVSEKASLLVREEIELAKAEISARVTKLLRGAVVGLVAGFFFAVGALFLLHGASWFAWQMTGTTNSFWLGFLIVAVILFILGGIGGALAYKFVKAGAPPTPVMAIDEARRIKDTVTGDDKTLAPTPTGRIV